MTTTTGLRYIDSDGHILEPPDALPEVRPGRLPGPHLARGAGRRGQGMGRL